MAETKNNFEETENIDISVNEEHAYSLPDETFREIMLWLDENEHQKILRACSDLHDSDIAELLEKSRHEDRQELIDVLGDTLESSVFSFLENDVRTKILKSMSSYQVARIISELDSDDALDLLEGLEEERYQDILRNLSYRMRVVLEEGLTFPEDSAGRLMQREIVAIPQFWTVGKTVDYLRAAGDTLPHEFYDIFVVDPMHHVVGEVALSKLLQSKRSLKIDTLIKEDVHSIPSNQDQEEVAFLFRRQGIVSAPVVDENNRLIGAITVDDVVNVIDEEAEEDFLKLGGVTNTDIYRAVLSTAKSRFSWLAVNLLTAIAASVVISFFEGTIKEIVALAVLMPIVASMGGNAGTQTLTVAVRALATKDLSSSNALRVVSKELMVGIINGILFAMIMGGLTWWWFDNQMLGGVIAMAMVVNLVVAGLAGVIIPLGLNKAGADPALSSAVFLTTITDILGFFAFLGLAAWLLL